MSSFLETTAYDLNLTRYLTFAAFTVLLYDHGEYSDSQRLSITSLSLFFSRHRQ